MTQEQLRASLAARGRPCLPHRPPAKPPRAWLPRPVAMRLVADATGVSVSEVLGPGRTRTVFRARALFFLLARQLGRPFSDTQLGRELGGRDRTTITNLARRAEAFRADDPDFAAAFATLLDRVTLHLVGPLENLDACH